MEEKLAMLQKDTLEREPRFLTGAEVIMECLIAEGVDTIFGYPGGAILPLYDILNQYRVNHYLVRHEQGAIHAAEGYARATGKIAVVIVTSGPGATNLVTGLADALMDSTPVVCITGQVAASLLGTDAFQEADIINTTMPVTKWNQRITKVDNLAATIKKAFLISKTGRPGPVVLDITKDVQLDSVLFEYSEDYIPQKYYSFTKIDARLIEAAAELINKAKRPFILCGQGVILSNGCQDLVEVAEKGDIPVACTLQGLSAIPTDHPLYVGYLGMHGNYAPNVNTNECDVLIAVGMRFDDRVTGNLNKYARQAKVIHIDIDASEINKLVRADIGIHADARHALQALIRWIRPGNRKNWLQSFKDLHDKEYEIIIKENEQLREDKLTMGQVIHQLNTISKGEAIIITDVGQHQMIASRYSTFNNPRSNISSGGMGTMGFALPAAMGAKLGSPEKQVIAIIGDAGVQMTIQELGTIAQYGIAVKIIVLNNNYLGMVRQLQDFYYGKRYCAVDMSNPDFVKIAEAYNIKAKKINNGKSLLNALQEMWDCSSAYFLEIEVEREENVYPTMPPGAGVDELLLQ